MNQSIVITANGLAQVDGKWEMLLGWKELAEAREAVHRTDQLDLNHWGRCE